MGGIGPDQPKIRLVDQGGGLERLAGGLACQPGGGQPAELVVHQGQELVGRPRLAPPNGLEHASHRSAHGGVISTAGPLISAGNPVINRRRLHGDS